MEFELTYEQKREAKKLFDKLIPYLFGTRKDPYKLEDAKYNLGYYLLTKVASFSRPDIWDVYFSYSLEEKDTLYIFVSYMHEDNAWVREEVVCFII